MRSLVNFLIGYKHIVLRKDVSMPKSKDGLLILLLSVPALLLSGIFGSLFFTILAGLGVVVGIMVLLKAFYPTEN